MTVIGYEKRLHKITDHVYAYLQPDGPEKIDSRGERRAHGEVVVEGWASPTKWP